MNSTYQCNNENIHQQSDWLHLVDKKEALRLLYGKEGTETIFFLGEESSLAANYDLYNF